MKDLETGGEREREKEWQRHQTEKLNTERQIDIEESIKERDREGQKVKCSKRGRDRETYREEEEEREIDRQID